MKTFTYVSIFYDKCGMQYKTYESDDYVKQVLTSNAMKNTVWVRRYNILKQSIQKPMKQYKCCEVMSV